jgi:hypothetical protein
MRLLPGKLAGNVAFGTGFGIAVVLLPIDAMQTAAQHWPMPWRTSASSTVAQWLRDGGTLFMNSN